MSKFANMKAKKDTVKKYIGGGALIQAGLGTAQTVYGLTQLPRARAEFERARAAAPSLETPAQYYENYKNAYDSELARMESDAIQANLATSIQALQGAGGRALVGGLGASVAQSQAARNAMLQRERAARLATGQQLARAEEATIGRKEARSQRDIAYANQAYQAALGNIGAGIGSIGQAALYGGLDFEGLSPGMSRFAKKQAEIQAQVEADRQRYEQTSLDQSAKIRSDFSLPEVDLTSGLTKPVLEYGSLGEDLEMQQKIRDRKIAEAKLAKDIEAAKPKATPTLPPSTATIGPEYSMFEDRLSKFKYVGKTSDFDPSTLGPNERYLNINGETFVAPKSEIDQKALDFLKKHTPTVLAQTPGLGLIKPFLMNPGMSAAMLINMSRKKHGGMMTEGEFNHDTNPIDIVQNGVKVGEATGNEYILNPSQAKKIAGESSYARKLFKRFEKQAKNKK